jgi:hypothetical protein
VPWLNGVAPTNNDTGQKFDVAMDLSGLFDSGDDDSVDAGVTSGSDPSGWDPIDVEGNAGGCVPEDSKPAADGSQPPICAASQ